MGNRIIIICLIVLGNGLELKAQIDTLTVQKGDSSFWKLGGFGSLTSSQVSFINWASGGENSVSINAAIGLFADLEVSRHTWDNSIDLAYGQVRQRQSPFTKADDKVNLVTKYGYQIVNGNKKWYFSSLLDFRTQFFPGYSQKEPDSLISDLMAPAYLVVGLGVDYQPNQHLSLNYIPATGKFTLVADGKLADAGAYGVPAGHKLKGELGSFFKLRFAGNIAKNINLESRLELFTNYVRNIKRVDVNLQNQVTMKVNEWITVNYFSQLIFDDDVNIEIDKDNNGTIDEVKPRVQFKSVLGVGLSINFGAIRNE